MYVHESAVHGGQRCHISWSQSYIIGGYAAHHGQQEPNQDPLEEQQMLTTSEPAQCFNWCVLWTSDKLKKFYYTGSKSTWLQHDRIMFSHVIGPITSFRSIALRIKSLIHGLFRDTQQLNYFKKKCPLLEGGRCRWRRFSNTLAWNWCSHQGWDSDIWEQHQEEEEKEPSWWYRAHEGLESS